MFENKANFLTEVGYLRTKDPGEFVNLWYNFIFPIVNNLKTTDLTPFEIIANVETERASLLRATSEGTKTYELMSRFNPLNYAWLESLPKAIDDLSQKEIEILNEKLIELESRIY